MKLAVREEVDVRVALFDHRRVETLAAAVDETEIAAKRIDAVVELTRSVLVRVQFDEIDAVGIDQ